MATVRTPLTPTADRMPVIVSIAAKELSGTLWVTRFLGSSAITELAEPFKSNANKFLTAISTAGGSARINATYRPPERAHLMHYSSLLSRGKIKADAIPEMPGVNIEWVHPTGAASTAAATEMALGYGIVYPPALDTNHTRRTAMDITITQIIGKSIIDAAGTEVSIAKLSDLNAVGATFGVHKLVSDRPHWSSDGH